MKVYLISMMNSFVLILLGLFGYFGSETPSPTALIPVFTGSLLLSLIKGVKSGNRPIAHFSAILTFLILLAMIKPLTGSISRSDSGAIIRVVVMMISCAITLGYFIHSFIVVRKVKAKVKG
jgi:hypothetical protein